MLINGSALAVNWANEHANAILEAWYPGEEGGAAIAETLFGQKQSRRPAAGYVLQERESTAAISKITPCKGRTYRYFTGKPLYPFGYGLSYTTFSVQRSSRPAGASQRRRSVDADVTVTNTGKAAGDEVVQLYLKFPPMAGAPRIALRGFQRIHLDPGQSQTVHFQLKKRDLGIVTENGDPTIAGGDYTISIGGGQPDTGTPVATGHFQINGQIALPE